MTQVGMAVSMGAGKSIVNGKDAKFTWCQHKYALPATLPPCATPLSNLNGGKALTVKLRKSCETQCRKTL